MTIDPLETLNYDGDLTLALEFLKRTRWELRELRKVRVAKDWIQVVDVNKDYFEIRGIGYTDPDVATLLQAVNTAFDPNTINDASHVEFKEFNTGRRHTWAEDRVM